MGETFSNETEDSEIELAFQTLCEFERNFCESIYQNQNGAIVYEIDAARLSELENVAEINLKDLDFSSVEYPSYQKLFEAKYKNKFLKNIAAISPKELYKKLGPGTLEVVSKKDQEIKTRYAESVKEIDLDNDGVPDRIDIDDTKNSVQTVADLDIVKNTTNKETNRDLEKTREKIRDELER